MFVFASFYRLQFNECERFRVSYCPTFPYENSYKIHTKIRKKFHRKKELNKFNDFCINLYVYRERFIAFLRPLEGRGGQRSSGNRISENVRKHISHEEWTSSGDSSRGRPRNLLPRDTRIVSRLRRKKKARTPCGKYTKEKLSRR